MNLEEIRQLISDNGFTPSEIFGAEAIVKDKAVIDVVRKEKQTEYEHAKRVEQKLAEEREDKIKLQKEYDEKISNLNKQLISGKTSGSVKNVIDERKLNEKQSAFVTKNLKGFVPNAKNDDELKVEINKFIDEQLKEYDETAKLFGVKEEGEKDDKGLPGDSNIDEEELEKYQDPKVNELIPRD